MGVLGRGDVPLGRWARESLPDRGRDGVHGDLPRERGERAEERGVRERPPEVLARDLRRRHRHAPVDVESLHERSEPQVVERPARVQQQVAVVGETREEVDLVEQRRILDDQRVGLRIGSRTRMTRVVDAAERDDRGAGPLGAEGRERLRLASLEERRHREQLGRRDDALAAAPMDANLEHARTVAACSGDDIRAGAVIAPYLSACGPAGRSCRGDACEAAASATAGRGHRRSRVGAHVFRQWTMSTSQCARCSTASLTLSPKSRSSRSGSRVPTTIRSA